MQKIVVFIVLIVSGCGLPVPQQAGDTRARTIARNASVMVAKKLCWLLKLAMKHRLIATFGPSAVHISDHCEGWQLRVVCCRSELLPPPTA